MHGLDGFLKLRRFEAVEFLSDVVEALTKKGDSVPDLELTFCTGDCVGASAEFNLVASLSHPGFPWPYFDRYGNMEKWSKTIQTLKADRNRTVWQDRFPIAVFRGDERTCNGNEDGSFKEGEGAHSGLSSEACGRVRLLRVAESCSSHFFDVKVLPRTRAKHLSPSQQERYKYNIYAEGHCEWANRLAYMMFMGTALIKQLNNHVFEWYDPPSSNSTSPIGLQPWVHYLPVDHHFNNIPEVVAWARKHDTEVQEIVANMHAYAEAVLTPDAIVERAALMFKGYAGLLNYSVSIEPGAVKWRDYKLGQHYLDGLQKNKLSGSALDSRCCVTEEIFFGHTCSMVTKGNHNLGAAAEEEIAHLLNNNAFGSP
jgi:hypothetical protein